MKTINQLSDDVWALLEEEKKLKLQLEEVEERRKLAEKDLQLEAEKLGLTTGGGTTSKFSISTNTVPQVNDWPAFYKFIARKKWFHLMQKRASSTACAELWERGMVIPGVDKFSKIEVKVKGA